MTRINNSKGNAFLSGFGTQDLLSEFYLGRAKPNTPAINVAENDSRYKIELGIPGFGKKDLNMTINQDHLIISGIRKSSQNKKDVYRSREFDYEEFTQTFEIPNEVNSSKISAEYKNGMLEIMMPKRSGKGTKTASVQIN